MTRMKRKFQTVALMLFLGLMPGMVMANAGKILFARGEVSIENQAGDRSRAVQGDVVNEGDRVRTSDGALAQIRLSDGALVSLRANSDYRIIAQKDEGDLLEQAGKLFSGWMRTVTGAIGERNPEGVSQETPVATIGIRGTTYQVIHLPEEGLPGFSGTQPGTYIYLQDGGIEVTSGGETRFLGAGEIVFVPAGGGVPVPAPDKKPLFSGDAGQSVTSGGDDVSLFPYNDRDDVESTDALNDSLDDILGGFNPDLDGAFSISVFVDGTSERFFSAGDMNTVLGGASAEERFVSRQEYNTPDGNVILQANDGETPDASLMGHYVFGSGGGEINWGVWDQTQYTKSGTLVQSPITAGPWQYMVASHQLTQAELSDVGLMGSHTYNYVGGTDLYQYFDPAGSPSVTITGGQIGVDFGTGDMTVILNTDYENYTSGTTGNTITDFYGAGIGLDGVNSAANIRGSFVGENAEGIVSEVSINTIDFDGTPTGTAAFAR